MPRNADDSGFRSTEQQLAGTMLELTPPPAISIPDDFGDRENVTLRLYADGIGRIPDEAAKELGRDFMVIRPACAILHGAGWLRATGKKRRGRSKPAHELVITQTGLDALKYLPEPLPRPSREDAA